MMGSVFVVGAGGVGKTTLINQYVLESGGQTPVVVINEVARPYMQQQNITPNDLKNQETFWKLNCDIISLQLQREKELEGKSFISDRSALDPVVYAAMIRPRLFPSLLLDDDDEHDKEKHCLLSDNDLIEELFAPLLNDGGDSWRQDTRKMLERYRQSLFLLVHPFADTVEEDGVRKVMSNDELERYTSLYVRILHQLGIPFVDVRQVELSARVQALQRALETLEQQQQQHGATVSNDSESCYI